MDIWVVSLLGIMTNVALNTHAQPLCRCMSSFLLGMYLGVELVGHILALLPRAGFRRVHLTRAPRFPRALAIFCPRYYSRNQAWPPFFGEIALGWSSFILWVDKWMLRRCKGHTHVPLSTSVAKGVEPRFLAHIPPSQGFCLLPRLCAAADHSQVSP